MPDQRSEIKAALAIGPMHLTHSTAAYYIAHTTLKPSRSCASVYIYIASSIQMDFNSRFPLDRNRVCHCRPTRHGQPPHDRLRNLRGCSQQVLQVQHGLQWRGVLGETGSSPRAGLYLAGWPAPLKLISAKRNPVRLFNFKNLSAHF